MVKPRAWRPCARTTMAMPPPTPSTWSESVGRSWCPELSLGSRSLRGFGGGLGVDPSEWEGAEDEAQPAAEALPQTPHD